MSRVLLGGLAVTSLFVAACSNDEGSEDVAAGDDTATTEAPVDDETTTTAGEEAASSPVGPGCAAVPEEGEGSFAGMATEPAATAASANPELTTLVSAVMAAELVDTLNGDGPFTIFAPTNAAFEKIPAATLETVLADKELLTSILTLHVIAGEELDAEGLLAAGSSPTVNTAEITFEASGESVNVNGQAEVVCANVETANATVHLIDSVLMPEPAA